VNLAKMIKKNRTRLDLVFGKNEKVPRYALLIFNRKILTGKKSSFNMWFL
jgi:hypothetical protein